MKGAKDPDEFIKKYGPGGLCQTAGPAARTTSTTGWTQLRGRYDLSDDGQRVEFLREAAGLIGLPAQRGGAGDLRRPCGPGGRHLRRGHGPGGQAGAAAGASSKEKKQQERRDLSPASQLQPKASGSCATTTSAPPGRRRGCCGLILLDARPAGADGGPGAGASSPLRCWAGSSPCCASACGRGAEHPAARPGRSAGAGGDGPPGLGGRAAGRSWPTASRPCADYIADHPRPRR